MQVFKHLSLLVVAACLGMLASCSSSGTVALNGDTGAQQIQIPVDANGMPGFPVESGPRSTSADGGSQTVLGNAFIQQKYSTVDGDSLVVGPSAGEEHENTAYGLYKFTGLAGKHLKSLTVNALPGEVEMEYFVALADFTHSKYRWFGPVTLPEFQYNFENDADHYISPLGNVYFIVATHRNNIAIHSSSTLTFGEAPPPGGGGRNPGAPSNLVASDGLYAGKVKLEWHAGDGAQWYEIWRHRIGDNPNEPEWGKIGESSETFYADVNVTAGHVYYYKVRSVAQGDGDHPDNYYSGFSNVDSGYPGQENPGGPGKPGDLLASDGTYPEIVRVTWHASDGAQWYELYRQAPNHDWALRETLNGTVFEDADVTPGVVYSYKVRAGSQGEGGNKYSDFSNIDTGYAGDKPGGDGSTIVVLVDDGYRAGTTVTLLGKSFEPVVKELEPGGMVTFSGLAAGSYLVFPYNPNHQFTPEYWTGQVGPGMEDVTLNFTGGAVVNKFRAWGFVWTYSNDPAHAGWSPIGTGLKAWLDGTEDYHTGQTNDQGFYGIGEMPLGTIIVKPVSEHHVFTPQSNHTNVDGEHLPRPLLFVGVTK